jgi:glycosyltransferase involved in cell wall biosynthesis
MTHPRREASPAQRIAVLVKRFPRLSETFILNEVLELRRQGLPVDVYAIMDPHEGHSQPEALALATEVTYLRDGSLLRLLPAAGRTIRRHPWGSLRAAGWVLTRHSRAAARNYLYALVLVDLLAKSGPSHLHAHFLHSPAAIAFIARKISGQPYSLTGHAKDIYTTLPENLRMRCRDAEFVTTCTAANRDHLVQVIGLDPSTVYLCRHGVDIDRFATVGHQPSPGRIVSIGRLVPKKGFDVLLRACGVLHRRGVAFELRIMGNGELRDDLETLAAREGIADQVQFLGARPQDAVIAELAAAAIFALTPIVLPNGDRDGIPNVVLEAMAVGVPVLASAVSGIPEVVVDGITGRLVPQQRPDLVAAVLAELLAGPSARQQLATAGRQRVLAHSGWEQAIAPIRDLLRDRLDLRVLEETRRRDYELVG